MKLRQGSGKIRQGMVIKRPLKAPERVSIYASVCNLNLVYFASGLQVPRGAVVAVRGLAVAAGHGALGQPQVPGPGLGVPGWQHLYTSTPALTLTAADNYGLEVLKACC